MTGRPPPAFDIAIAARTAFTFFFIIDLRYLRVWRERGGVREEERRAAMVIVMLIMLVLIIAIVGELESRIIGAGELGSWRDG